MICLWAFECSANTFMMESSSVPGWWWWGGRCGGGGGMVVVVVGWWCCRWGGHGDVDGNGFYSDVVFTCQNYEFLIFILLFPFIYSSIQFFLIFTIYSFVKELKLLWSNLVCKLCAINNCTVIHSFKIPLLHYFCCFIVFSFFSYIL